MIFGASPSLLVLYWFSAPLEVSCGNREPATEYDRSGQ